MFSTVPGSEVHLPSELRLGKGRGHRWRLVEQTGPGFFIAVISVPKDGPDGRRTAMIYWDSDIVHLIESPQNRATFYSLYYVCTTAGATGEEVELRKVCKIWRGVDRAAADAEVIIFTGVDGSEFCGMEAIPVPDSVERVALITIIGTDSPGEAARE